MAAASPPAADAALPATGTSNEAIAGRYDEIPYDALPHAATHPARLAAVATFVGRSFTR